MGPHDTRRARRRASTPLLALLAAALAGCLAGAGPDAPADAAGAPPRLSCPEPCLRPVDAGVRWEPSVAVDPLDPRHLVVSSQDQTPDPVTRAPRSWPLSHVSFDGGATWTTTRLPGGPSAPPTHPLFRYHAMDDSAVAFLPDGTLLWSAVAIDATTLRGVVVGSSAGYALVVLRSTDGGLTFPEATVVQEGSGRYARVGAGPVSEGAALAVDAQDKQWFALAPDGAVLLAWSRNRGGTTECPDPTPLEECTQLVVSTSTDGGRTWSPPGVVAEGGLYSGAYPVVRRDGGWVVSYRETRLAEAHVAVSTDRGATWTATAVDRSTKFPVLAAAVGPAGERLHLAYPASELDRDEAQAVALRWSDDGGLAWSEPLVLDAPKHPGRTIPAIAPARGGGVVVLWWSPLSEGGELRAVHVRDGVASPPLVLDATEGPTAETGDYMGLAPMPDGSVYAAWIARHGRDLVVTGARLVPA